MTLLAPAATLTRGPASLASIMAPASVAVIGASRSPAGMGHRVLRNLINFGFTGAVYPVNPKATSVCSVRAYSSVEACPDTPDIAVIVVPKDRVLEAAEECGFAGVKGLIVLSAGFRESGASGAANELRLMEIVRRYGMRMIGPNCMGIVNADPAVSMNATFAELMPPFGQAAFLSQSGAIGVSVLDSAREYGLGISQFVSVGNKPDVSGNDLLEYWEHDPTVRVILMYVESFGNPARFRDVAGRITRTKPIVVVKSGRSRAGARAASSHTGALAASDTAVDALLAQAGVLRASSMDELFDIAMAFESRALPKSRRTAVLTNAGGPGILAADALESCGLELAELSASTVSAMQTVLPDEASIRNPLDMIASATPAGYGTAMRALLADPNIDVVVPIFVPPFGVRQEDVATAIVDAAQASKDKVVLSVLMGRDGLPQGRAELHAVGIPTYVFPESAARALGALTRHVDWMRRPADDDAPLTFDRDRARAIIDRTSGSGGGYLDAVSALELLECYGIPVARARLSTSASEAARFAEELGLPVALKVVSADIVHKTDVGGVRAGLTSTDEVLEAWTAMREALARSVPSARIGGILVQPMRRGHYETIVGMTRDPGFGPLVMFGLGGVFVEALRDVTFRLAPVSAREALDMIEGIRGAAIFDGMRGAPPADRAAIVSVIRRVGQLAMDFPEITELDVNPLMILDRGVVAVDARVRIAG